MISDTYDALPYGSVPIPQTAPDYLLALARLYGVDAPDATRARVLEIGCAEGGNIVPLAFYWPEAEFVGIERSREQVAAGDRLIHEAGLGNVRLIAADLMDIDGAALGSFDVIVAHGFYSWVPETVRDKAIALIGACLAPNGVAYVSFNVAPGWGDRGMLRAILREASSGLATPADRLLRARAALADLAEDFAALDAPASRVLRDEIAHLAHVSDSYLFHEYLEEVNEPVSVAAFAHHAACHGLILLADAEPSRDAVWNQPPPLAARVDALSGVSRLQWLDFARLTRFRRSLLVRVEVPGLGEPAADSLDQLAFSADVSSPDEIALDEASPQRFETGQGLPVEVAHPVAKAALMLLSGRFPDSVAFSDLLDTACEVVAGYGGGDFVDDVVGFRAAWLKLALLGVVRPSSAPRSFAAPNQERPRLHRLARAELGAAAPALSTASHRALHLDAFARELAASLDGRRGFSDVLARMRELFPGHPPELVAANGRRLIELFAREGIFEAAVG